MRLVYWDCQEALKRGLKRNLGSDCGQDMAVEKCFCKKTNPQPRAYLSMSELSRTRKSRDHWKTKATLRRLELKNARKREAYYRTKFTAERNKVGTLQAENGRLSLPQAVARPAGLPFKLCPKVLGVLLVFLAVVSFRSVPKILKVSGESLSSPFRVPHFSTVIEWCLRVGLAAKTSLCKQSEPWIALIDLSIDVGLQKMLVILRVPLTALQKRQGALTLEDCECCGCYIRETWRGEHVADALEATFDVVGVPIAVLKDQGSELGKAIKILKKSERKDRYQKMASLVDVGHFAACALKAWSQLQKQMDSFLKLVSFARKDLSLHHLSFLKPPALRVKGRFMALTRLAKWAQTLVPLLPGHTIFKTAPNFLKLQPFLRRLGGYRFFLNRFCETCQAVEAFLKHCKHHGINQQHAKSALKLLEVLPSSHVVRQKLETWTQRTLNTHCRLGIGQTPLPVSTDILESLFGKFKYIHQRGSGKVDFNRTILLIYAMCGPMSEMRVAQALTQVRQKDLDAWEKDLSLQTQAKKRKQFLSLLPGQKMGEKAA